MIKIEIKLSIILVTFIFLKNYFPFGFNDFIIVLLYSTFLFDLEHNIMFMYSSWFNVYKDYIPMQSMKQKIYCFIKNKIV